MRSTKSSTAIRGLLAWPPQALAVLETRGRALIGVGEGALDRCIEMPDMPLNGLGSILDVHGFCQLREGGTHPPRDLNRGAAEIAYLLESKREIIGPARHRHTKSYDAGAIAVTAPIEDTMPEPNEQVLDLRNRLHGRRRIIDRRRQRFHRDIDQQPDRKARILLEG